MLHGISSSPSQVLTYLHQLPILKMNRKSSMRFCIKASASILMGLLFIVLEVKSQSPSPSPSPNTSPSSSPQPTTPPPTTTPLLDPQTAAVEVQKIFDIFLAKSDTKDVDLFAIYSQYKSCQDRLAIEKAYTESKFNFDKNSDDGQGLSDDEIDNIQLFMATFLTGCNSAIVYAYHLKYLSNRDIVAPDISEILVASSESAESNLGLQNNFNDRFSTKDYKLTNLIEDAVKGDAKNVCLGIISSSREKPLASTNPGDAQATADDLVKEESETKGWKNDRKKLDAALMITPLNQCQLVVQSFKKDGKDLRQTFEDDFKDDGDKLIVYVQLFDFISSNTTFYSNELYYGLVLRINLRVPMRIFASVKQNSDLLALEKQFEKDNPDIVLRERVKKLTSDSGFCGKFFQKVLDEQWADADSQKTSSPSPSVTPSPPSSSSPIQTSSPLPPLSPSPSTLSTSPPPSP